MLEFYRKFFSIHEIEQSKILQLVSAALLLGFFITFFNWNSSSSTLTLEAAESGRHLCWPFFQNCGDWYFLSNLPDGYSYSTFYMGLFAVMAIVLFFMWQKDWLWVHIAMMVLFLWEGSAMLLSMDYAANYWYFHLSYTFILLTLPHKLFFLRLSFVFFYFLAGSVKIHEGWIMGTYFSSLKTGLPLTPDFLIPIATNLVIFMEIVGSWFLLNSRLILQRLALGFFTIFHLFSGILVRFMYPAITLPLLLILFGSTEKIRPPFDKKSIFGYSFIVFLIALQSISWLIPGDAKLTLEGNHFGVFMFEANHQCINSGKIYLKDGTDINFKKEYANARYRCDPYERWFHLNQICVLNSGAIDRIEWKFDHSINGGPFYRIVNEENACNLEYRAFSHNDWIKFPKKNAEIIGYPVKNFYR